MTLFQSTAVVNGVTVKNMTNTEASENAINAASLFAKELGINSVIFRCVNDGNISGENASCFEVLSDIDELLCNVDNDGVVY